MICDVCKHYAATTERMWTNRQRNMATYPNVNIAPCGSCGGTEYVTTRAFIKPDQPPRRRWWQRLFRRDVS